MRTWLGVMLACASALAFGAFACGSDDDVAPGTTSDDAGDGGNTDLQDGASPGEPSIVAPDVVVYTKSNAVVDASTTVASSFSWTVKSAPNGSAVTTASLTGANTPRPSFVADVSGEYELELTAQNGAASATKVVKVRAVPAPLFYMQANGSENPAFFEYRTIGSDGTGSHPIACRVSPQFDAGEIESEIPDSGVAGAGPLLFLGFFLADITLDWWEAPPGTPSRVAFGMLKDLSLAGDGGFDFRLALGTNENTCQNPPAELEPLPEDGGVPASRFVIQPKFSPNGARVAFVESRDIGYTITTVGYDGTDQRIVARFCPEGNASCAGPSALFTPRPQWLDAQTIGWARESATPGVWEVMLANDSANPMPRVHMTCPGVSPRAIAFLSDGRVIANGPTGDTRIEDLRVWRPDPTTKECQLVRNLTNLPTPLSYARDFAVSPDGTEVVFVRYEGPDGGDPDGGVPTFGGDLYRVAVDGTSPPVKVAEPSGALYGGRYIASGSQIAWNGIAPFDAGPTLVDGGLPAINVVSRSGGEVTSVVGSDANGTFVIGGGNGGACDFRIECAAIDLGCSVEGRRAARGGVLGSLAVALVLVFRRRGRVERRD